MLFMSSDSVAFIDLIDDGRLVGFAIIVQISYALFRGQTAQVREIIAIILATQVIFFKSIFGLSSK